MRYQTGAPLGQGEFAVVYQGTDTKLSRDVAIKQLHAQYLADPKQLEKYWAEAQLVASLEHPHIISIYDIVPDQGWLIMELMQGSLKNLLDVGAMGAEDVRQAIVHAATALGYLHNQGIVHGDVKPSNLFISKTRRLKLGDFGLARRATGDDGSAPIG